MSSRALFPLYIHARTKTRAFTSLSSKKKGTWEIRSSHAARERERRERGRGDIKRSLAASSRSSRRSSACVSKNDRRRRQPISRVAGQVRKIKKKGKSGSPVSLSFAQLSPTRPRDACALRPCACVIYTRVERERERERERKRERRVARRGTAALL